MLLPRFTVLLAIARFSSVEALSNSTNSTFVTNVPSTVISNATSTVQDAASACNAQYISYSQASKSYLPDVWITNTVTNTYVYNKTVFSTLNYDCTQKCDTICYAGNVSRTISLSSISSENTITYSQREEYPGPTPSCSIGFSDCLSLLTSYSEASTTWYSAKRTGVTTLPSPIRPSCSACVSTSCTFQHAAMSLYYWPVTTSYSKDMCAWDPVEGRASTYVPDMNRTYAPTTTGPYAVVEGRTLYQGNVYLSILEPYVYDNCGNSISRRNAGGDNMITIASTDLYSVRKYPHNLIPWSVNYADFIEPVPWSAYLGGRYCANNRPICSVVFPGDYKPDMVMPPQMRNLDPAWESCAFDQYGLFDPPIALQTVSMFISTTTEVPQQTPTDGPAGTPPAPGNLPPTTIPSATTTPTNDDPNPNPSPNPEPTPTANDPSRPGTPVSPPVITVGPPIITADPTGGVIVAPGTTISVGGPGIIISSTSLSIGSSGLVVVSPATSTNIPFGPTPTTITLPGLPVPITLNPTGDLVIAPGTTLTRGGAGIVISSTTFSVGASGLVVIAPATSTEMPFGVTGAPITLLGLGVQQVMTVDSEGRLVMEGGKTLHAGDPAVTIDGTTISVGASEVVVIHGKITETYDVLTTTTQGSSGELQSASRLEDLVGGKSGTGVGLNSPEDTGTATGGSKVKGVAGRLETAGMANWVPAITVLMLVAAVGII